jgi:hypothetical protein
MDTELERLEQLKKEAIENPGKPLKKKPCNSCKNREVNAKELTIIPTEELYIPTVEEITKAYVMLGNPKDEEKPFIKKVYRALFNDEFDFTCNTCVHKQTSILKYYMRDTLNIKM